MTKLQDTQEIPRITRENHALRNIARSADNTLDSVCEAGGSFLSHLPMSVRLLISAAVAYAITDTAIYFDKGKHIHQYVQDSYNSLMQLPDKAIDGLLRVR